MELPEKKKKKEKRNKGMLKKDCFKILQPELISVHDAAGISVHDNSLIVADLYACKLFGRRARYPKH